MVEARSSLRPRMSPTTTGRTSLVLLGGEFDELGEVYHVHWHALISCSNFLGGPPHAGTLSLIPSATSVRVVSISLPSSRA
jgi:hypothetical protein